MQKNKFYELNYHDFEWPIIVINQFDYLNVIKKKVKIKINILKIYFYVRFVIRQSRDKIIPSIRMV